MIPATIQIEPKSIDLQKNKIHLFSYIMKNSYTFSKFKLIFKLVIMTEMTFFEFLINLKQTTTSHIFLKCENKNIKSYFMRCKSSFKNFSPQISQICDEYSMIITAFCVKMTEYKVVQNAGISLTKGACVTLEVFIYIAV